MALAKIAETPEGFLQVLAAKEDDVEPEAYIEQAVTHWLPAGSRDALHGLGKLLEKRHKDAWLTDLLVSEERRSSHGGPQLLAASRRFNLAGEMENAIAQAVEAGRLFRQSGNIAGWLRAGAEESYARNRTLKADVRCVARVNALLAAPEMKRYPWIEGRTRLELGNCFSMLADDRRAVSECDRAASDLRSAGYRRLELRAIGLVTGNRTRAGDPRTIWTRGMAGLALYWTSAQSVHTANQFYVDLTRACQQLGYLRTALRFRRAAVDAASQTEAKVMEAQGRSDLAAQAIAVGEIEEARTELSRAQEIFAKVPQTDSVLRSRIHAELAIAEIEAAGRDPQAVFARLDRIGDRMPTEWHEMRLRKTRGMAFWKLGDIANAENSLREAVRLAAQGSRSLHGGERSAARRLAEPAYRVLVEILLPRNPEEALQLWEAYRSGIEGPVRWDNLATETVISYLRLRSGWVAWIADDRGVKAIRLNAPADELDAVGRRFVRACSDPRSSVEVIRRDARQLFVWLIAPLANGLSPKRTIVLEGDGILSAIPFTALMDDDGSYLADRYSIIGSRSAAEYQKLRTLAAITAQSTGLVIANPALGPELSAAFPPLIEAEREAAAVAAGLPDAVVLRGEMASREALDRARRSAEVFHFAGHGFSDAGNGGLLLAGGDILSAATLAGQNWRRCRLVVLSACSTGAGETVGPVNPESLVSAFLTAGVGRVIASRWSVDSASSGTLIAKFYRALLSGLGVAPALREATGEIRRQPSTSHPYYWASFQTFGGQ